MRILPPLTVMTAPCSSSEDERREVTVQRDHDPAGFVRELQEPAIPGIRPQRADVQHVVVLRPEPLDEPTTRTSVDQELHETRTASRVSCAIAAWA